MICNPQQYTEQAGKAGSCASNVVQLTFAISLVASADFDASSLCASTVMAAVVVSEGDVSRRGGTAISAVGAGRGAGAARNALVRFTGRCARNSPNESSPKLLCGRRRAAREPEPLSRIATPRRRPPPSTTAAQSAMKSSLSTDVTAVPSLPPPPRFMGLPHTSLSSRS